MQTLTVDNDTMVRLEHLAAVRGGSLLDLVQALSYATPEICSCCDRLRAAGHSAAKEHTGETSGAAPGHRGAMHDAVRGLARFLSRN